MGAKERETAGVPNPIEVLEAPVCKPVKSRSKHVTVLWRYVAIHMDGRKIHCTEMVANGQYLNKLKLPTCAASQVDHYAQDKRCEDKWYLVSQCFYQGEPYILFPSPYRIGRVTVQL